MMMCFLIMIALFVTIFWTYTEATSAWYSISWKWFAWWNNAFTGVKVPMWEIFVLAFVVTFLIALLVLLVLCIDNCGHRASVNYYLQWGRRDSTGSVTPDIVIHRP